MLRSILNILNKPYPYYIPFSESIKLLVTLSIIIPAFLIIFRPFGLEDWSCEYAAWLLAGMTLPIFAGLVVNFYGVSKIWPWFFNEDSWNIGKEIIWSIWNTLIIILFIAAYWQIVPFCQVTMKQIDIVLLQVMVLSIFPESVCISFNYIRALKIRLKRTEAINKKLIDYHNLKLGNVIKLVADNDEKVAIPMAELLFMQSYDNYAKIVWNRNNELKNKLIRSSLKNLESQISESFITRCHRSFIVNLTNVEKVIGNARGYKLRLRHYPELIPVSRENRRKIFQRIQSLEGI